MALLPGLFKAHNCAVKHEFKYNYSLGIISEMLITIMGIELENLVVVRLNSSSQPGTPKFSYFFHKMILLDIV